MARKLPVVKIEPTGTPDSFRVLRKRRILPGWHMIARDVSVVALLAVLRVAYADDAAAYKAYDVFLEEIGCPLPIDLEARETFNG